MPAGLRATPLWADRLRRPSRDTFAVDYAHPLCPDRAWFPEWPARSFPELILRGADGALENDSIRPDAGVSPAWGEGLEFTNAGSAQVGINLGNEALLLPTTAVTVVIAKRKVDASNRAQADFGIFAAGEPGSFVHRCGAHIPFSDGTVYWDFGGVSGGSSRLSVGSLTFGDDIWAFTTGARGMEIWQNGLKRASNGGTPTRTSTAEPFMLADGQTATGWIADLAVYALLYVYHRQLSEDEVVAISFDPFQWCVPILRSPRGLSFGGGGGGFQAAWAIGGNQFVTRGQR